MELDHGLEKILGVGLELEFKSMEPNWIRTPKKVTPLISDIKRVGLAEHVVTTPRTTLHKSGINITIDSWFTSTKLAGNFFREALFLVGTLKKTNQVYLKNLQLERSYSRSGIEFIWISK